MGRTAVVTGAANGIGRGVVERLLDEGANVVALDIEEESLKALRAELGSPAGLTTVQGDIRSRQDVKRAIDTARQHYGALDVMVANAGIAVGQDFLEIDDDTWTRIIDTNLGGVYNTLAVVLPRLRAARAGGLVIVSSVAAYRGLPRSLAYGPSKAALNNLAEALYLELHDEGVAVTVVCPGFVRTPLTAHNPFPMPALIEPCQAARAIIDGLERGAFEIHFPRRFTTVMKTLALLPAMLYLPLLRWLTR